MRIKDRRTGELTNSYVYQVILDGDDPEEAAIIDRLEELKPGRRQNKLRQYVLKGAGSDTSSAHAPAARQPKAPAEKVNALDEFDNDENWG